MKTDLWNDLVRLAKENGWKLSKQGSTIVLRKGRSVIDCQDNKKAIEFLQTNNI